MIYCSAERCNVIAVSSCCRDMLSVCDASVLWQDNLDWIICQKIESKSIEL